MTRLATRPMPGQQADDRQLENVLQRLFLHQAREVLSRLTASSVEGGVDLDPTRWLAGMSRSLKPLILQRFQQGAVETLARITRRLRVRGRKSLGLYVSRSNANKWVLKEVRKQDRAVGVSFDLFNPRILDAVDAAVMQFCRDTNDTAGKELDEAVSDLRSALKEGMSRGEALNALSKRVTQIFASPDRARRIAATESNRARHLGQVTAAKESGEVRGLRWLASSDSCDACRTLGGKEVGFDQPFYVDPKGGAWAVVLHPPRHPFLHVHCDRGAFGRTHATTTILYLSVYASRTADDHDPLFGSCSIARDHSFSCPPRGRADSTRTGYAQARHRGLRPGARRGGCFRPGHFLPSCSA